MSDKDYEKDPLHVTNYNLDPEAITDSINKMNYDLFVFYLKYDTDYKNKKWDTININEQHKLLTNCAILRQSKDYDLNQKQPKPLPKRIESLQRYQNLQNKIYEDILLIFPNIEQMINKIVIPNVPTIGFVTHVKDYDMLVANDIILNKMNENLDGAYNRYMAYLESSLPPENRYNMSPDMLNAINFYYLLEASMKYKLDQLKLRPQRKPQLEDYQKKQLKYYNTLSPIIKPYINAINQSLQNPSTQKTGGARQRKKSKSTPYRAKSRSKSRTRSKSKQRTQSKTKK
jgi:hypothetical protein